MNKASVLAFLDDELSRLQQARQLLDSDGSPSFASGRGWHGGVRHMSAAARARISAAQKARWAKVKAAEGASSSQSGKGRRHMSAESRARIATAQKARWARQKEATKKK